MPNQSPFFAALTLAVLLTGCTASAGGPPGWPLPDAESRPTPLHFGLAVTPDPENNPIDPPERFSGIHVGTDFEIFEGEEETDVPVFAICPGRVLISSFTEGYGGLVIQRCTINKQAVTVLYGHLKIDSLPKKGKTLKKGAQIGVLGTARTKDTDGNRKHLHLAIHKGTGIAYLGYVQTQAEVDQFMDPLSVLPSRIPL